MGLIFQNSIVDDTIARVNAAKAVSNMIKKSPVELIDGLPEDVRLWPEYNEIFYDLERMAPAKPFIRTIVPFMTNRAYELLKSHGTLYWDGTFPTSKSSPYEQIAILSVCIPASDPTRQCRVFPVFAAYLKNKRKESYVEYLNVFLRMAPAEFRFETIYCDGELTLQSALDEVFPATTVVWFQNFDVVFKFFN